MIDLVPRAVTDPIFGTLHFHRGYPRLRGEPGRWVRIQVVSGCAREGRRPPAAGGERVTSSRAGGHHREPASPRPGLRTLSCLLKFALPCLVEPRFSADGLPQTRLPTSRAPERVPSKRVVRAPRCISWERRGRKAPSGAASRDAIALANEGDIWVSVGYV